MYFLHNNKAVWSFSDLTDEKNGTFLINPLHCQQIIIIIVLVTN